MNRLIQLNKATAVFFVVLGLGCFCLSPLTRALSPPPDGAYPAGNTAEGQNALLNLTTGGYNAAIGWLSLRDLSTGSFNTAVGAGTLALNNGDQNTALGVGALLSNKTASENTAQGAFALFSNTVGDVNTAIGVQALFSNTSGSGNIAVGYLALSSSTTGLSNTAVGNSALLSNTGDANTAIGLSALIANTTGVGNTAVGVSALDGNTTGSANTALGADAGVGVATANGVTCIGHGTAGADVSNTTWIGNVYGVATVNGTTAPVIVSADGQLGTVASSQRFKKNIATMKNASEAILSLRPVTFHYKSDAKETPQFGLIAEEVTKVNPALVLPDKDGKPYTVRYDAVNTMLLNEFLKEHSKVEKLEATVAKQHKDFEAALADLKGQIHKVSAQLELSKAAPQTVLNNR
jgi:Chaperone of endosialidase